MASSEPFDVSIPPSLSDYVANRVASGKFADASEFVTSLIEADRRHKTLAEIERLVIEGLNSGPPIPVDDAFWVGIRERVRQRAAEAKS